LVKLTLHARRCTALAGRSWIFPAGSPAVGTEIAFEIPGIRHVPGATLREI
jgi:hypothetical protein